ncbi:MAG: HAD family hydrolase, partial [Clostridia bacterium]|nr:HAD family hydrolase [Clostridia bacterium]
MDSIKWIFFDIGYTLVNEDGANHVRNLQILSDLAQSGAAVTEQKLMEQVYREVEAGHRPPHNTAAAALGSSIKRKYVRAHETPYHAATQMLAELHRHYRLGIIASQSGGTVERLRKYRLLSEFDLIFSSEEIGLDKPNPEFFRAACRNAGCLPGEAAMVGD